MITEVPGSRRNCVRDIASCRTSFWLNDRRKYHATQTPFSRISFRETAASCCLLGRSFHFPPPPLTMSKRLRSSDTWNVLGGDDITALVDSVFGNLREGIWWRVLPIEGTNDDICTGTGQAWDVVVLLPLLLERDFIRVHGGEPTLSGYQFRKRSWETLCTTFRGEGQLQMGTLQTKKGGKAWYIAQESLVFQKSKVTG
jgi:hypothetical protein